MRAPGRKPEFPSLIGDAMRRMELADLRARCVDRMAPSGIRERLMDGLEAYVAELEATAIPMEVWVEGSFTSEDPYPSDVDIVVCLSHVAVEAAGEEARQRLTQVLEANSARDRYHCHVGVMTEYPPGHDRHWAGEAAREYWFECFATGDRGQFKGVALVEVGRTP